MDERELCFLPAATALTQFRNAQLSPVELLNTLITRSEKVEPSINAFTDRYFEDALAKAAEAEQRYAKGNPRPLEGLPIAIKDEVAVGGQRSTQAHIPGILQPCGHILGTGHGLLSTDSRKQ
jgi:aspartyl-tRNA(Asn)/glutamyl-tRNA(Gln) amidotransferase subunit A